MPHAPCTLYNLEEIIFLGAPLLVRNSKKNYFACRNCLQQGEELNDAVTMDWAWVKKKHEIQAPPNGIVYFQSCPVIQVYSAENLESALAGATRTFCEQEVKVYEIQRELHVSRVFQWYCQDFGQNDVEAIRSCI